VRWLGFRLMLGSGLCKVYSNDKNWSNGMALSYHYWSQPMPNWISYYVNLLPLWFHKFCCFFHFFVELAVPFGSFYQPLFIPTFLLLCSLQVGILLTGNYGFFNLLSILIPFTLVNDSYYPSFVVNFVESSIYKPQVYFQFMDIFVVALVGFILTLSWVPFSQATRRSLYVPTWLIECYKGVSAFGIMSYYGLFAKMTTFRFEVIIEGSNGSEWKEYQFRYKPGLLTKSPRFVIGHLPRLDWRMWFCQFQSFHSLMTGGWYDAFLAKLLKGSPEVLGLLEHNPFPNEPPKYIRSMLYEYQFADEEHRKQGFWWTRKKLKMWWPPCGLTEMGKLVYLVKPK